MPSENKLNTIIYKEGKWSDVNAATLFKDSPSNLHLEIAMEIKLTD